MLDSDARKELLAIEKLACELEELREIFETEQKRNARLKSAKAKADSDSLLVTQAKQTAEKERELQTATAAFFEEHLGISEHCIAVKVDADGTESKPVVVHMMRARALSDGSAVLTVSGDEYSEENYRIGGQVVPNVMLLAAENANCRLVCLS